MQETHHRAVKSGDKLNLDLIMALSARRILIAAFVVAVGCFNSYGKSWRGIVPFHSSRADVERILGTTPYQDE